MRIRTNEKHYMVMMETQMALHVGVCCSFRPLLVVVEDFLTRYPPSRPIPVPVVTRHRIVFLHHHLSLPLMLTASLHQSPSNSTSLVIALEFQQNLRMAASSRLLLCLSLRFSLRFNSFFSHHAFNSNVFTRPVLRSIAKLNPTLQYDFV